MFIMPEVVVQRVLRLGIEHLRANDAAFDEIFYQFLEPEMLSDYGQTYIDQIKAWFSEVEIPVVQSWSFNPDRIPSVSIHLASETEDEAKAAIGDFIGDGEESSINTGVFTTNVDIGIHCSKNSDQTLWLYYILSYILFKEKQIAERLGLQIHTWTASDYQKDSQYMSDNIWTRWIRFRCTTQNTLEKDDYSEITDVEVESVTVESSSDDE